MFARLESHPWSLLILLLLIIILFGWKRLPDAARSVGRSMRIFKSEVSEMRTEGRKDGKDSSSSTVEGETLNEQQAAAAEARRKAAEARAAAERAEREAADAERQANGSTRV